MSGSISDDEDGIFPTGADYQHLSVAPGVKLFAVDEATLPTKAGWVTPADVLSYVASSLPAASTVSPGVVIPDGVTITVDSQGHISGIGGSHGFTFTQAQPSDTWTILHGLDRYPAVTIVDSNGNEVLGGKHYDNSNQVTMSFTAPIVGIAYLT